MTEVYTTSNSDETISVGFKLAKNIKPGFVISLTGDLGAGKTEFVKGVCDYFKVENLVSSPTFTIINQYEGVFEEDLIQIYHIDLYRIKNPKELIEIGFDECISDNASIKLIEWPDKAGELLNNPNIRIKILADETDENLREITIDYLIY